MEIIRGYFGEVTLPKYGEARMFGTEYKFAPDQQAVLIDNSEFGPIMTMTVCLPEAGWELEPGEFFVQTYNFSPEMRAALLASGWFEDTGRRTPSGFVDIEIWRWGEKGKA